MPPPQELLGGGSRLRAPWEVRTPTCPALSPGSLGAHLPPLPLRAVNSETLPLLTLGPLPVSSFQEEVGFS